MAHAAEEPPLAPRLLAATANAWCRGAAALAASAAARGAARAEALSAAMDATEAQLALLEATMDSVGDLAALEAQAAGTRLCLRVWGAVRAHGASGAPRGCWEAQSDNSIAVASSQRTGGEAYPRAAQGAPFAGNDPPKHSTVGRTPVSPRRRASLPSWPHPRSRCLCCDYYWHQRCRRGCSAAPWAWGTAN